MCWHLLPIFRAVFYFIWLTTFAPRSVSSQLSHHSRGGSYEKISSTISAAQSNFITNSNLTPEKHHKIYDHHGNTYQGENCRDLRQQCPEWATNGRCEQDPIWMLPHCPQSCRICGTSNSSIRYVPRNESIGPVQYKADVVVDAVGATLGIPQRLVRKHSSNIMRRVAQAEAYLYNIQNDEMYKPVRELCKTRHYECAYWAVLGECDANENYMNEHCAPVCFTCELLHTETRCPIDPDEKNAWYRGDLNAMFERIVTDPYFAERYHIEVLSRPEVLEDDDSYDSENSQNPWILQLDNFLNETEALRLIELGQNVGYERSTDVGELLEDGSVEKKVSQGRTSLNAWCNSEECLNDSIALSIYERMERLTNISSENSEALQLLRYEEGQFYKVHHDYISLDKTRAQGVRILTIFLYLNDMEDEAGGGTNFPRLDLTVQPKLGRALIWPSVLNERANEMDPLTHHQALEVTKGVKYGANSWIHQRRLPDDCE